MPFRLGTAVALVVIGAGMAQAQQAGPGQKPVPPASAAPADDGRWTMPAKNYAATRYTELDQINAGNAKDLQVAFTFSTGVDRGHEAAPIVDGQTMYIVTPYPNYVYALDLTKPGAPLKWMYKPKPAASSQGVACCDVVNRGGVLDNGRFFFNTLDDRTIALDAATGRELWDTKLGDINKGETITMAPLVAKGKVLVGNAGGEFGVRGWITAVDAQSGKIAWRAYNTGPDSDVLIGPDFKPFYPQYKGQDRGVGTWPPEQWRIGGGTVWGWVTYDPDQNLIFYGTGNPGPWNPEVRPGDNLWTSGIFARDADTGQARWFYQTSPHDLWDYDGINEQILLDMPVNGQPRRVMVRPERDGYIYILDRTTGEVLSADPFVDVDVEQGRRPQDRAVRSWSTRRRRSWARRSATSAPPRRARRTGSPRPTRRRPASSTSRTRTCAWTGRTPRSATSRACPTSAPTCTCTPATAATAARCWPGTR